jgi:hypothetical protein
MSQLESSKPTPSPTVTAEPAADPKPTVAPPQLEPGTVVATGRLGGDPLVAGDVEIRAVKSGFELRLLNFTMTHGGDVRVAVSPRTVEPGTKCTSSIMTLSWGSPFEYADLIFPLYDDGFTDGDPSYLRSVLIEIYDGEAFAKGCYISVLSSAVLDWTLPDMRPGLEVVDKGKTGGANGEVTVVDGVPVSYTVAPNDIAAEVAARFNISIEDLFYLNPTRMTIIEYPLLQLGEELNVSKAHRGQMAP